MDIFIIIHYLWIVNAFVNYFWTFLFYIVCPLFLDYNFVRRLYYAWKKN
nr:MAG TPA: hypothetical protein [Caudoviricetes sp.]